MNDEVANKIVDAYRTNPILTGLLLLNVLLLVGFYYHSNRGADRTAAFVTKQLEKIDTLQKEMLDLAKTCVVPK